MLNDVVATAIKVSHPSISMIRLNMICDLYLIRENIFNTLVVTQSTIGKGA